MGLNATRWAWARCFSDEAGVMRRLGKGAQIGGPMGSFATWG